MGFRVEGLRVRVIVTIRDNKDNLECSYIPLISQWGIKLPEPESYGGLGLGVTRV